MLSDQQKHKTIAEKLVDFADSLSLNPYDENGHFSAPLQPVSHHSIHPIHVITPNTSTCVTPSCQHQALLVGSHWRDAPKVTLIKGKSLLYTFDNLLSNIFKGTTLFDDAYVVPGKCPKCLHIYYADHSHIPGQIPMCTFLNSAKYLKVGQSIWVDRIFSNAVLAGMYHFHASATAYTAFWNSSFWENQKNIANPITHRHIWQTFTQESICSIAALSQFNISLHDHLSISDLAREAFNILGENGIIQAANQHAFSECIQPYKRHPDFITGEFIITLHMIGLTLILMGDDPAATVGLDEGQTVPVLHGEGAELAVQDAEQARELANEAALGSGSSDDMEEDGEVSMVVIDGIDMGPTVCLIFFIENSFLTCYISSIVLLINAFSHF